MKEGKAIMPTILIVLFVIFAGSLWVYMALSLIPTECVKTTYILKGINGMTDENDGLLSGGDVSSTTLLMDDGTVITLRTRISELHIGKPVTIKKCKMVTGSYTYSYVKR